MDAGLELIYDAEIVVVADHVGVGLVEAALETGGAEVAGAQLAEPDAGEVHGERDGEEGHCGGHGEPGLQQSVADGTQIEGGEAGAEGDDV